MLLGELFPRLDILAGDRGEMAARDPFEEMLGVTRAMTSQPDQTQTNTHLFFSTIQ
jgi:hypothetical protein